MNGRAFAGASSASAIPHRHAFRFVRRPFRHRDRLRSRPLHLYILRQRGHCSWRSADVLGLESQCQ